MQLTEDQRRALQAAGEAPVHMTDPETQVEYVVVRADVFARLTSSGPYDSDGWTDEEMDLLAAEDADRLGWEGMDVYQDQAP